jgi:hypothetical protein
LPDVPDVLDPKEGRETGGRQRKERQRFGELFHYWQSFVKGGKTRKKGQNCSI